MPPRSFPFRPLLLSLLLGSAGALLGPAIGAVAQSPAPVPAVDPASRREVVDLFNTYYGDPARVPMAWTGSLASGDPGDVAEAYRALTLQRINYFRRMAGLSGDVVFSAAGNATCQQAALMFAAQHNLSHSPPADWKWWTPDAARAAGGADIRCESGPADEGPDAVTAFIADNEANNTYVGHRRWLLYPAQTTMASGSVPALDTRSWGAAAIWVLGPFGERPAGTPEWTAWPPAGFVPAPLVFRRWSFSYPNADFTNATVAMTKDGNSLPVAVLPPAFQSLVNGNLNLVGDNTLVWEPQGNNVNHSADETYAVTVDNVRVAGQPRRFAYTVTSLDPAAPLPPPPGPVRAPVAGPTAGLRVQVATASHGAPTSAKIALVLSEPLSADTTVGYAVGGSATGGADYQALPGAVSLGAGGTRARLKAVPLPGGGNGPVAVTLAPGAGYTVDPNAATVTVTVTD